MDDETPKETDGCEEIELETSSLTKALQSFPSRQSAIDKAMAAMASPSAIDKTLQSFASRQSAFDKAKNIGSGLALPYFADILTP